MRFVFKAPKWFRKVRRPVPPKAKLFCEDCKRPIHKFDRYRILKVRHIDCGDPKHVGQTSFPAIKEDR